MLLGQAFMDTNDDPDRFSEDMGLIDAVLPCGVILPGSRECSSNIHLMEPTVFTYASLQAFVAIARVGVVIAAVPYFAVAVPFLVGILIPIHRVYVRASRQLRLHELVLSRLVLNKPLF